MAPRDSNQLRNSTPSLPLRKTVTDGSPPGHSSAERSRGESRVRRPQVGGKSIKLPPRRKPKRRRPRLRLEEFAPKPIEDPLSSLQEDTLGVEPPSNPQLEEPIEESSEEDTRSSEPSSNAQLQSPQHSSKKRPRNELPVKRPSKGMKTLKLPPRPNASTFSEGPVENSFLRTRPNPSRRSEELIASSDISARKDELIPGKSSNSRPLSPQHISEDRPHKELPLKRPTQGAKSMALPTQPDALRRLQELIAKKAISSPKDTSMPSPSSNPRLQVPQHAAKEIPHNELSLKRPSKGAKSIALPIRPEAVDDPVLSSSKDRLTAGPSTNPHQRSPRDILKELHRNELPSKRPLQGAKSVVQPSPPKAVRFSGDRIADLVLSSSKDILTPGPSTNPRLRSPHVISKELPRIELPPIPPLESEKSMKLSKRPKLVRFSEGPIGDPSLTLSKDNARCAAVKQNLPKKSAATEISEIQSSDFQSPTRQEGIATMEGSIFGASPVKREETEAEAESAIIPRHLTKKGALPTNKNPFFVRDYFGQSRLHFIGSFRARYESMIGDIARTMKVSASSLLYPSPSAPVAHRVPGVRTIVHIDMDCFFASVAMAANESLKGKPIAVCHGRGSGNGSGEVSSCSYEARKFGVKAGMFFSTAKTLCPDLIGVPYDFPKYEAASFAMYIRFYSVPGAIVEALSVDEAYLDLTNSPDPNIEHVIQKLRADILSDTGCNTSAGIGPNKLYARLATTHAKPNGQFQLSRGGFEDFIKDLPIGIIPGIGRKKRRKFESMGVETGGDLRGLSLSALQAEFGGKQGEIYHNMARGIDDSPVEPMKPRKSIGAEISWGVRFERGQDESAKCTAFLKDMAAEVCQRCLTAGALGRKLVYKVYETKNIDGPMKYLGHGPCNIYTKSVWLDHSKVTKDNLLSVLETACIQVHRELKVLHTNLRGVGMQVTELEFEKLPGRGEKGRTAKIKSYFPQNEGKRTLFDAIPLNLDAPVPVQKNGPVKKDKQKKFFEVKKKDPMAIPSEFDEDTFRELPEWLQKQVMMERNWRPNGTLTLAKVGADGRARATAAKKVKVKKQTHLTFKPKASN